MPRIAPEYMINRKWFKMRSTLSNGFSVRLIFITTILVIYLAGTFTNKLCGQTPSDDIMMQKNEICFGLIYESGQFDQYWEGTHLRTNATIATVNRDMILPMAAFGFTNAINIIVFLPYVKTFSSEPNGGKFGGVKGFQDLGVALKVKMIENRFSSGDFSVLFTAGYSTPATNYLSDYRPYSIGFGADEISARTIIQYKTNTNFYGRMSVAYLHRGLTRVERDYYYNNGSYYTDLMDVPSAWNFGLNVGKWAFDNSLKLEAGYIGLHSTSGDDVRAYNAPQPTNKVHFGQLAIGAHYYLKNVKGLGVLAGYTHRLSGRNAGKMDAFRIGITYQFDI